MDKKTIIFSVSLVLTAAAGFAGGYLLGQYRMKRATDDIINQLNDEVNDYAMKYTMTDPHVTVVNGNDPSTFKMTPEQEEASKKAKELTKENDRLKKEYMDRVRKEGYKTFTISDEERKKIKEEMSHMSDEEKLNFVTRDEDDEERIKKNEEMGLESDEDYEERMADTEDVVAAEAQYNPVPPYMIDEQEYMDPQFDSFTKQLFTYFGDGTLIDDGDEIIPNADDVVGLDNLIEFESGDKDRIFVRNEAYSADYEILYKELSYSEWMGANN